MIVQNLDDAPPAAKKPQSFPNPVLRPCKLNELGDEVTSPESRRSWRLVRELRSCIYGSVKLAIEVKRRDDGGIDLGDYFAIKVMYLSKMRSKFPGDGGRPSCREDPMKEVAVMQYLLLGERGGHPNVLSILEALQDEHRMYIIMPFCPDGEMFNLVCEQERGCLSEEEARPLFRQVLEGLQHLQSLGICHRDMSMENLLLCDDGRRVVINDFGMALRCPQTASGDYTRMTPQGYCGKRAYVSPEVFLSKESFDGFAIDVWACGIILYSMLTGKVLYKRAHESDAYFREVAIRLNLKEWLRTVNPDISSDAAELMQSMLICDSSQRATVSELLQHPWLQVPEA